MAPAVAVAAAARTAPRPAAAVDNGPDSRHRFAMKLPVYAPIGPSSGVRLLEPGAADVCRTQVEKTRVSCKQCEMAWHSSAHCCCAKLGLVRFETRLCGLLHPRLQRPILECQSPLPTSQGCKRLLIWLAVLFWCSNELVELGRVFCRLAPPLTGCFCTS